MTVNNILRNDRTITRRANSLVHYSYNYDIDLEFGKEIAITMSNVFLDIGRLSYLR